MSGRPSQLISGDDVAIIVAAAATRRGADRDLPVTTLTSSASSASFVTSVVPACDTALSPSALTLTRDRLPLRFTSGVPSCQGSSIIQQFDSPSQARHFSALCPPPSVKDAARATLPCP